MEWLSISIAFAGLCFYFGMSNIATSMQDFINLIEDIADEEE